MSLVLMLCGIYGMHNDWTTYIVVIPFGWLLVGVLFDWTINGNRKKENPATAILCTLILLNVILILTHRDTAFIVGRILFCAGASVLLIRISGEAGESK